MTEFDLIIKNGKVVTASDMYVADVGVKDGKIDTLSSNLTPDLKQRSLMQKGSMFFLVELMFTFIFNCHSLGLFLQMTLKTEQRLPLVEVSPLY